MIMSRVLLGDIASERKESIKGDKTGYPIVGLEHIVPGQIKLTTWDSDSNNSFSKLFRKGDVLFGRRRAYLKKAAEAPFDGICSGDITVITPNAEMIIDGLLPFIIQNDRLFDFAVGKSAGSLSPRVKWDNLKNYPINIPDKEQQPALLELLEAIESECEACSNALAAAAELKASYLDAVFQQKIRFRDDSGEPFALWPIIKLERFADKLSRKNTGNQTERALTISALDSLVDQKDYFDKTIASKDMSNYYLLHRGEFAYNKSYSIGYPVGSIKRLDLYDEGALSNLYICFSLKPGFDSDYIKYYFESSCWYDIIYKIVEEGARAHGLLNVSKKEFFETEHRLSINEDEQRMIVESIKKLEPPIEALKNKLTNIQKMRQAILDERINANV